MTLPSYQEQEKEFLEAMATRFEFSGKNRIIFVQRFSEKNAESDNKHLAYEWERELLEGTREGDAYRIFRQQLGAICDKLEAEGCKYEGVTKGKWKKAKRWLQEDLYQEWIKQRHLITLTCDQLWQQLWEKATHTDKMKPLLVKSVATLDMGGEEIEDDEKPSVPLGSKIYFQLQLEKAGYLLLLEKGTSGKMWCLSPSGGFAPNPHLSAGVVNLPLLGARQSHFKLTGNPGVEEVVAVIAKDKPTLEWLSQVSDRLLELREDHLKGLLEYLNHSRDCQILRMAYRVTA
jgi:hypothetical protein